MARTRASRGASVVEAIVASALAGLATAGLAATAFSSIHALRLARDTGTALALAGERLEALRVGPRVDGADTPTAADGTPFTRAWHVHDGRGAPSDLSIAVGWDRHRLTLDTRALP